MPPRLVGNTDATQPVRAEHVAQAGMEKAQVDHQALPAWLRDPEPNSPSVTQPIQQHAAPPTQSPSEHVHKGDPNETASELPFWLSEERTTAATPTDHTPAAPQQSFAPPAAAASDAQNVTYNASEDSLPAWLIMEAAPATDAPTSNDTQLASPEPATTTVNDDALPAWLFAVDAQPTDGGTTPTLSNPLPSSTGGPAPTSLDESRALPKHDDSLRWLEGAQAAPEPPAATTATFSTDELPAWLRDDPDSPAPAQQNDASFAVQDLPAWLRDNSLPSITPTSTPTALEDLETRQREQRGSAPAGDGSEIDSLPAWLRDDTAMSTQLNAPAPLNDRAAEQPSAGSSENEPLPAWLRQETGGSADDAPAAPPAHEASMPIEQDTLPAWLYEDAGASITNLPKEVVLVELPASDSVEPVPVATARVYEAADASVLPSASTAAAVPEPVVETSAVYDAPPSTEPSEASIAALLATPVAAPEAAPAPSTPAVAPVVATVADQEPAPTVVQPSTPPPVSPVPVLPPQPAQRGYGLWIMLIIVLVLAVLAVGWLALRLNGIIS